MRQLKETRSKPKNVTDAEAREIERRQAAELAAEVRGERSTLQGRVMGYLESMPGSEAELGQIVEALNTDDQAEVVKGVGALLREGLLRTRRVGVKVRYVVAP